MLTSIPFLLLLLLGRQPVRLRVEAAVRRLCREVVETLHQRLVLAFAVDDLVLEHLVVLLQPHHLLADLFYIHKDLLLVCRHVTGRQLVFPLRRHRRAVTKRARCEVQRACGQVVQERERLGWDEERLICRRIDVLSRRNSSRNRNRNRTRSTSSDISAACRHCRDVAKGSHRCIVGVFV